MKPLRGRGDWVGGDGFEVFKKQASRMTFMLMHLLKFGPSGIKEGGEPHKTTCLEISCEISFHVGIRSSHGCVKKKNGEKEGAELASSLVGRVSRAV